MGRGTRRGRLPGVRGQSVRVESLPRPSRRCRAPRATRATHACLPILSVPIAISTATSRPIASSQKRSRCSPVPIRVSSGRASASSTSCARRFASSTHRHSKRSRASSSSRDALAVLERAPSPTQGRALSLAALRSTLRRAGRQRNLDTQSGAHPDGAAQRAASPSPTQLTRAFAATVRASVAVTLELTRQIDELEHEFADAFQAHPDAEIMRSLPGLGLVLGARVLGEFGDAPNRYKDGKRRRCYAGTAPITRASGTRRVVLARIARNRRLADALYLWAFAALTRSHGARALYNRQPSPRRNAPPSAPRPRQSPCRRSSTGCLQHRETYDEPTAWAHAAA